MMMMFCFQLVRGWCQVVVILSFTSFSYKSRPSSPTAGRSDSVSPALPISSSDVYSLHHRFVSFRRNGEPGLGHVELMMPLEDEGGSCGRTSAPPFLEAPPPPPLLRMTEREASKTS